MSGAGDRYERRALDRRRHRLTFRQRDDRVIDAMDDGDGNADRSEHIARISPARHRALRDHDAGSRRVRRHLFDERDGLRSLRIGLRADRRRGLLEKSRTFVTSALDHFVAGLLTFLRVGRRARIDEREAAAERRVEPSDRERDVTTHRTTGDERLLDPNRLAICDNSVCEVVDRRRSVGKRCGAETGHVRDDDAMIGR